MQVLNTLFPNQYPYNPVSHQAVQGHPQYGYNGINPQQSQQLRFAELQQYRFTPESRIEKPNPVIFIGSHVISTRGNIMTLVGPPKAGKSALINAILAGAMVPLDDVQPDLLGLSIEQNKLNKAVVHVDGEQSLYDHYKGMKRLLDQTTGGKMPNWFHSYNFRAFEVQTRKAFLQFICERASEENGGIHIIVLDGGADFVLDTNDQKESNEVVRMFETLAIKYNCPVVVILHFNPGTQKGRGHFGSQLERKSETVLSVVKNEESEISTIKGKLLRNSGCIPQLQFIYDTDKGHHVHFGVLSKASKEEEKKLELQQLAEKIFRGSQNCYNNKSLSELIMFEEGVQVRSAQDRIKELVAAGVLVKSDDPRPLYSFRPLKRDDANQV